MCDLTPREGRTTKSVYQAYEKEVTYISDNSRLKANAKGIPFRESKHMDDHFDGTDHCVYWGHAISGVDDRWGCMTRLARSLKAPVQSEVPLMVVR